MIDSPVPIEFTLCVSIRDAIDQLQQIYERNILFLNQRLEHFLCKDTIEFTRCQAYYPAIKIVISHHATIDPRNSYGYMTDPGEYITTITRPELFANYLAEQLEAIRGNHECTIYVGESNVPIPIHFAITNESVFADMHSDMDFSNSLRNHFDTPNLDNIDDTIVNGKWLQLQKKSPLSMFTAPRVDYSLKRLEHYTSTHPEHFQNFIIFTNYGFYVDEFKKFALSELAQKDSKYYAFVETGNNIISKNLLNYPPAEIPRTPQMPTFHLKADGGQGITLINIGVGPSNAKNITDHLAVLRPSAWIMVGHCAGLRSTQNIGDYVLAHAYARDDQVLDRDLPLWVPIPALAEIQLALEKAVADVTGLCGWELKSIMRTGTVATISDRNWELEIQTDLMERFSLSRAIALDMESGTIAANGFRFRIPYGTLLCVSDKPLHGELKLPGMASSFYKNQVAQHLLIGIRAIEILAQMDASQLHSRKLRGYLDPAFK